MPGLSMEPPPEPYSPSEEDPPADSEWRPRTERGVRRRQRNRDAARKSRQKTTERADQLHQELQLLERDNSSLQKEISALQRDRDYYSSVLERHVPHCCLNKSPTDTTDTCSEVSSAPTPVPSTVPPLSLSVPGLHTPPSKSNTVSKAVSSSVPSNCFDLHTPTQTSHSVPTPVPTSVPLLSPLSTCSLDLNLHLKMPCTAPVPLTVPTTVPSNSSQTSPNVPVHSTVPSQMSSTIPLSSSSLSPPQTSPNILVPPTAPPPYPSSSTKLLGLHTAHQTSLSVSTPVPTNSLGPPQMSLNVPVHATVPPQMSSIVLVPSTSTSSSSSLDLHTSLKTLSHKVPTHVQTNPLGPPLVSHTVPVPPHTLLSSCGVRQTEKSHSMSGPTAAFSTLLPVHPSPLLPPHSAVPPSDDLLSLGPAVDPLLLDRSLDMSLFTEPISDLTLVQLLEDNDWILNTQ